MAEYWFNDIETLRNFGTILTTAGILDDSDAFANYLSAPFEYNAAYNAWLASNSPEEGDENWDTFVDAITEDEDDDEEEE